MSTTRSAVLFLIFNRPDTTTLVFEQIRAARPPRLYVAADAPRPSKPGEKDLCDQTRAIATKVDWPCEVKTLFREKNLGCKEAVAGAVTWFFSNEPEGIVLEDDCLPSPEFFSFCDAMLERYRDDGRVRHITGSNLQHGQKRGDASYYFSRISHVWGWAGWRRVWNDYDKELKNYRPRDVEKFLKPMFRDPLIAQNWGDMAEQIRRHKVNTWDYQLGVINLMKNGVAIIPAKNLISNIGFRADGTHTLDTTNINASLPIEPLGPLTHPTEVAADQDADFYTLNRDFALDWKRRKNRKWYRKVRRFFRRLYF